jgi:hypothetical protein
MPPRRARRACSRGVPSRPSHPCLRPILRCRPSDGAGGVASALRSRPCPSLRRRPAQWSLRFPLRPSPARPRRPRRRTRFGWRGPGRDRHGACGASPAWARPLRWRPDPARRRRPSLRTPPSVRFAASASVWRPPWCPLPSATPQPRPRRSRSRSRRTLPTGGVAGARAPSARRRSGRPRRTWMLPVGSSVVWMRPACRRSPRPWSLPRKRPAMPPRRFRAVCGRVRLVGGDGARERASRSPQFPAIPAMCCRRSASPRPPIPFLLRSRSDPSSRATPGSPGTRGRRGEIVEVAL